MNDESSTATPQSSARGKTFKPRAGVQRKTKAERDEYAKQEAEKAKTRAAQDTLPTVSRGGSRGGRGGARGGKAGTSAQTEDSRSRLVDVSSGIFGAGSGSKPGRAKKEVRLESSEALGGDSQEPAKPEKKSHQPSATIESETPEISAASQTNSGKRTSGTRKDNEVPAIESEDDLDERPRRDIERIWISSEEEGDEDEDNIITQKRKQKSVSQKPKQRTTLRPVRAPRITSGEEELEAAKSAKKPIRAAKSHEDAAVIDVDTDEMQAEETIGTTTSKRDPPYSPELARKPLRRASNKAKDPKFATETAEERAERLRMNEDIKKLKDELFIPSQEDRSKILDPHAASQGRLFLFQFPPLVPALYDPAARSTNTADQPIDVDGELPDVQIKPEPGTNAVTGDASKNKQPQQTTTDMFTASSSPSARFPAGLVGKLKIRQSGKVTLDWGGTDMEVRLGSEVDFLQDAVLVETPNAEASQEIHDTEEEESKASTGGKAYALGQVRRKMVLVPDWGKLYA